MTSCSISWRPGYSLVRERAGGSRRWAPLISPCSSCGLIRARRSGSSSSTGPACRISSCSSAARWRITTDVVCRFGGRLRCPSIAGLVWVTYFPLGLPNTYVNSLLAALLFIPLVAMLGQTATTRRTDRVLGDLTYSTYLLHLPLLILLQRIAFPRTDHLGPGFHLRAEHRAAGCIRIPARQTARPLVCAFGTTAFNRAPSDDALTDDWGSRYRGALHDGRSIRLEQCVSRRGHRAYRRIDVFSSLDVRWRTGDFRG